MEVSKREQVEILVKEAYDYGFTYTPGTHDIKEDIKRLQIIIDQIMDILEE